MKPHIGSLFHDPLVVFAERGDDQFNGLFANFADLQSHMSQDKAGDTIIADGHGDSLTLTHVAMATLQAHDFLLG